MKRIREAIDNYPGGLCFASPDGRPILANKKINELCFALTGHTIMNANEDWAFWKSQALPDAEPENSIFICCLRNDEYWQFKKTQLVLNRDEVIQYEAADVTALYQYGNRLKENNLRVKELHEHQKALLDNIALNNLERELLGAKMRIHDDFGRLLIMTKNALKDGKDNSTAAELFPAWENIILDIENATVSTTQKPASPKNELLQVADMIGCKVDFYGNQPTERKALLLLYAAIREALTNAVRHAGANRLSVRIEEEENDYRIRIENNGTARPDAIREGGGLGNLRRRLESEGAVMDIRCENGVVLCLKIPRR